MRTKHLLRLLEYKLQRQNSKKRLRDPDGKVRIFVLDCVSPARLGTGAGTVTELLRCAGRQGLGRRFT